MGSPLAVELPPSPFSPQAVRARASAKGTSVMVERPINFFMGRTGSRNFIVSVHLVYLPGAGNARSEEHTSELQSLMRISYAVFCLKKKKERSETNTYDKHSITLQTTAV